MGAGLSMTNEELALRAREGDSQSCALLWQNIRPLICKLIFARYTQNTERCKRYGVEPEDLIQEGFFAMLEAVRAYDPEKGFKFASYLNFPVMKRFNEAVGIRRHKQDPIDNCTSLDCELPEGDSTIGDFVPDEASAQAFDNSERETVLEQLKSTLDYVLNRIEGGEIVKARYLDGETYDSIGKQLGVSCETVRRREAKALKQIQAGSADILKPFYDELIGAFAYGATGLSSFRNQCGSNAELTVERMERFERSGQKSLGYLRLISSQQK